MSEDLKKHVRTQGKYSDIGKMKSRDKRLKISPGSKEPPEKKHNNRHSNESKGSNGSFTDENISPVKYEENSDYSFEQLESPRKPIEIYKPGKEVLSITGNGESIVVFEPHFLEEEESNEFFDLLYGSTPWYSKNIIINGEEKPQPRKIAWFGPYPYSYSGATLEPAEMPDCVVEIKTKVERYLKKNGMNATFNSVLLNLYRSGKDSVAWHSDDELSMGICPTIASVSLGEMRKFEMRPKKKYSDDDSPREKQAHYFANLSHGSLIIMDGSMQDDWQHRVPKESHDKYPRINLTFRTVYPLDKAPNKVPVGEFKKKQVDNVWRSNKTSSCKTNFDDADFPPLDSNKNFPPLSGGENIKLLSSDENIKPFSSGENFKPFSSDVNPSFVSPNSDVKTDFNDSTSSSSFKDDDCNKSYETWDKETAFDEKFNVENNLHNYDPKSDSSFVTNDVKHEEVVDDPENAFEMIPVERCDDSAESPSTYGDDLNNKKPVLNALAKEFIPNNTSVFRAHDYSRFPLEALVHYEVNLMHEEKFWNFSDNLKIKVMEKLNTFSSSVREELLFLCTISDGDQTEKNQKLITSKMIHVILNDQSQTSPDVQISYDRPPSSQGYGKGNHIDRDIPPRPQNYGKVIHTDRPPRSQSYGKVIQSDRPPRSQNYGKINHADRDRPPRSQNWRYKNY